MPRIFLRIIKKALVIADKAGKFFSKYDDLCQWGDITGSENASYKRVSYANNEKILQLNGKQYKNLYFVLPGHALCSLRFSH